MKKSALPACFAILLCLGIFIFHDYGISWDENTQRNTGIVFLNHVQKTLHCEFVKLPANVPELKDYQDREFGGVFEVFLFSLERMLNLQDYREVYLFRHFLNFIFFCLGAMALASIIRKRFESWYLPLIGFLLFITHPRIFAESFYNSKDMIVMVFFVFSFYFYLRFVQEGKYRFIIFLALFSAITFNIRPIGLLIPFLAWVILGPQLFMHSLPRTNRKKTLISLLILTASFLFFTWLTNPYLWSDPFGRAYATISKFLQYDVSHTAGHVLFLGRFIPTNQLPWYYLPLWIGITTPVVHLFLFLAGILILVIKLPVRNSPGFTSFNTSMDLFIFGWMLIPVVIAVSFHSTMYDGWRHFYFLWPAFIYAAIAGAKSLIHYLNRRILPRFWGILSLIGVLVVFETMTVIDMIRSHPYQYCYFNPLAPAPSRNFELDYWGLSYHDALVYLTHTDRSDTLRIKVLNLPGYLNAFILPPADRKRLYFDYSLRENYSARIESYFPFKAEPSIMVKQEKPTYYLSNFRDTGSPDEIYNYWHHLSPYSNQVYSIKAEEMEIMGIYRLPVK